jgi:hypothetical protein
VIGFIFNSFELSNLTALDNSVGSIVLLKDLVLDLIESIDSKIAYGLLSTFEVTLQQ